jgi:hypothetical protein
MAKKVKISGGKMRVGGKPVRPGSVIAKPMQNANKVYNTAVPAMKNMKKAVGVIQGVINFAGAQSKNNRAPRRHLGR